MRWLINYIRSCFCEHDFELVHKAYLYDDPGENMPVGILLIYRCRKCGYVQKIQEMDC